MKAPPIDMLVARLERLRDLYRDALASRDLSVALQIEATMATVEAAIARADDRRADTFTAFLAEGFPPGALRGHP